MDENQHTIGTRNEIRVPLLFGSYRPRIWLRHCKDERTKLAIREYILNRHTRAAAISLAFLLTLAGCAAPQTDWQGISNTVKQRGL